MTTTERAPAIRRRPPTFASMLFLFVAAASMPAGAGAQTAPVLNGVAIQNPPVGNTFESGDTINVSVSFSAAVTVTGSPQLALNIGLNTRQAAYVSGSGGATLVFRHVVLSTDLDADGISIGSNALTLNSGTINGSGGTAAQIVLGGQAVTNSGNHRVNGATLTAAAVSATAIASTPLTATTYGQVETIEVEVTFGRRVLVTGTPQLALRIGSTDRQANYVSIDGRVLTFRYVVQPTDSDNGGISVLANALTLNGGTIFDARDGTTAATRTIPAAQVITDDTGHRVDGTHQVGPTVTGVSMVSTPSSAGVYGAGERIEVRVTFNLPVWATGTPQLALQIGTNTRQANYVSGRGTRALVFRYVVVAADRDTDGIALASADALTLNGGALRLAGGNRDEGEDPQTRANAVLGLGTPRSFLPGHAVDGAKGDEGETEPLAFDSTEYVFELTEKVPGPVVVGRIGAGGGTVQYSLVEGAEGRFEVDAGSGEVSYVGPGEDAEMRSRYVMRALATAGEDSAFATVTVRVVNVNEGPAFEADRYVFELAENAAGPLVLGAVAGADLDEDDTLTYRMASESAKSGAAERFRVDPATGDVRYVGAGEDYEAELGPWQFAVSATDLAGLSATTQVVVELVDVNEAPAFGDSAYAFELGENAAGPLVLGAATATDPDQGDLPAYSLAEGDETRFDVDAASGLVRYVGPGEDAETSPQEFQLVVAATDRGGLRATSRVTVALVDLNEAPTFVDASYEFELAENAPGPLALGTVEAVDPDRTDTLSYALEGQDAAQFDVDASGGGVRYVGAGEDAEAGPAAYEFSVVARDLGGLTSRAAVTVRVLNVNEAPAFSDSAYAFELAENAPGPLALGAATATDPDGADPLTYSLARGDETRFEVDAGTGGVRYVGAGEDYEAGPSSHALVVRATDAGGLSAEAAVTVALLNVNEGPEAVGSMAPKSLEAYGAGVEEDLAQYFRDPDGDALTYVAESSVLEVVTATVAAGGRLSIQPRAIGAATVTVTATDPGGLTATQQVQVQVDPSRAERALAMKASLAAFGQSVGTETVEAVGGRLGMESSGAAGQSHMRLGGRTVDCGPSAGGGRGGCGLAGLARSASGLLGLRVAVPTTQAGESSPVEFDPLSWERLGSASSFQVAFGGARDGAQHAGAGLAQGWTLWGRAGATGFDGPNDNLFLEGATRSAYLGLDYRFGTGLLVGLAGSRNSAAIDVESQINGTGSVDARLTSLYPYLQWSPRPGLGVWGLAGAGRGSADMSETAGTQFAADLTMRMGALGARQELYRGFAVKADAFAVRIQSDAVAELAGVTANARRLRLAPELSARWSVGRDISLRAQVEAGARWDGGDAQTGAGAEAGAAFGFAHRAAGLEVDVRGRTLLAHQAEDYGDWGAGLAVRFQPGGDQEGLSLMVAPTWGNPTSGVGTLWRDGAAGLAGPGGQPQPTAAGALAAGDVGWTPGRVAMEVGWGVQLPGGGQVTPFGRWSREGPDGHRLNVGTRWTILGEQQVGGHDAPGGDGLFDAAGVLGIGASDADGVRGLRLDLDLFGEHVAASSQPPTRRLTLQGRIGFK